ncbi:uncharacterized protein [Medicago truncatula]|uniref:uncharacterized protein n=1 Tax=Medicago truncatula TaxID=3880 RepID=UPI0019689CE2|nr:uncharacterized protein LOC120579518 [Medicago truncatula]
MTRADGSSSQSTKRHEPNVNLPVNYQFMEEPDVKEAEDKIWKSQVIISCPNSSHGYLGPLPDDSNDPEKLNTVFPCSEDQLPLIFSKGPYDLSFLKSKFRTEPKIENNEKYLEWLDKVEKTKGSFWKEMGIFDLIQLSRQGPKYHNEMIIAALHFWNPSTNSLHLKCGMLTPTLLDVAGLVGLKPIGQTFDPDTHSSGISFDFSRPTYGNFIIDHHKTSSATVSDQEHIAFLTYWLSMYIFCSRSIQIPKKFTTLAIQLHEGRDICLSKLILGSLYENLNHAVSSIKDFQPGSSLIIPGPIWLFQLWLLATFRTKLAVHLPPALSKAYDNRSIEGLGLAMLQYGNRSSPDLFAVACNAFLGCTSFTSSMAPFTTRSRGPSWFTAGFPTDSSEEEVDVNAIWEAYLTPTFLSSRVTVGSPYGVYGYQPNHVARQFGLIQIKPSSLYKYLDDLRQLLIEHVWRSTLRRAQRQKIIFEPKPYTSSFACTETFYRWWQCYFKHQTDRIDPDTLLPELILAFHTVQRKSKKNRGEVEYPEEDSSRKTSKSSKGKPKTDKKKKSEKPSKGKQARAVEDEVEISPDAAERPAVSEPLKLTESRRKRKHDPPAIETDIVEETLGQPSLKKMKTRKDSNPNSAHSCVGDNALLETFHSLLEAFRQEIPLIQSQVEDIDSSIAQYKAKIEQLEDQKAQLLAKEGLMKSEAQIAIKKIKESKSSQQEIVLLTDHGKALDEKTRWFKTTTVSPYFWL